MEAIRISCAGYPTRRTFDEFVSRFGILAPDVLDGRCEMDDILLEMDRILRPEGSVIIRDEVDILVKVKRIVDGF
ncbi:hypothetical protein F0562_020080 [Nyssa sinensis]|uniref:Methyltransferase n=1 Tax=Nyssa sinensis TaxID=561372 RepID=A0A5J5BRP7_9ASTE|nr:hypothetical protein F0562_020080 [Nyssa sinensis]